MFFFYLMKFNHVPQYLPDSIYGSTTRRIFIGTGRNFRCVLQIDRKYGISFALVCIVDMDGSQSMWVFFIQID